MNSLAKKITILQITIISGLMFAFIAYIGVYLSDYTKVETLR